MEIQVKNTNEEITVRITIQFVGEYSYNYTTPTSNYSLKDPQPYNVGNDLIRIIPGQEIDNWNINLYNYGRDKFSYVYYIEWFEGGDLIFTWPEDPNDREGDLSEGERITKEDYCQYV